MKKEYRKKAITFIIISLALTALTIPAQIGIFDDSAVGVVFSICCACIAGVFWVTGFCLETYARGYNPLWGLLLSIPPFIFIYPFVFKYKNGFNKKD